MRRERASIFQNCPRLSGGRERGGLREDGRFDEDVNKVAVLNSKGRARGEKKQRKNGTFEAGAPAD